MKLDSKDSNMNQSKRDKSVEIKETKEKLKQEKLQKEKEKKEREKQEKERKEREKKEKKEREKAAKKGGGSAAAAAQTPPAQQAVTSSSTTSALNRIATQESGGSSSEVGTPVLTSSKSDNVLSKLKKKDDAKSKSAQQPQTPPVAKGRYRYQVVYLDETVKTFELEKTALGEDLVTVVCEDLALIEKEYFSLTYRDVNNMKFWLDHEKKIKDQLKGNVSSQEPVFNFEVKFYPPEPNVLQEEITRYLLTLQLRHDIMDGKLPCTFVTHALLGSYTVQAELGDYDEIAGTTFRGINSHEYLEGFCFAPNQTPELLEAIANCHRENKGQTPAEAEMHYLENAVKLAMYGVDLHNAKDSDGVDILVGVSASGLLVFRDHLRINRFAWPKILKISYKRNHFYLKLRPGEFEKYETTIGFRCPNHKAAKRLWKIAVEHHSFFRLREPEKPTKSRILPTFNSQFRYTGSSTYMQSRHRSIERQQPAFTRSLSKRLTQSMDRGLALQHPIDTPGSVQSAAFNHFNRVKPHMSASNIGDQRNVLRESQEDLEDLDQGGDYNVNERLDSKLSNQVLSPSRQTNNYQPPPPPQQQNIPKINPNFVDRFPKDSANFSNRSTDSRQNNTNYNNSYNPIYQSINKKSTTMPNFNQQNTPSNRLPNEQATSFEHLDEYYTSVVDPNSTPSMKHALADSVASLSGSNKISTPILSNNQQSSQQPQRYAPARQVNPPPQPRQPQAQLDADEFDENGNLLEPIGLSPRPNQNLNNLKDDDVFLPNSPRPTDNLNNSQLSNLTVSSKYSDTFFNRRLKDDGNNSNNQASNTSNTSNVRDILREIRNRTSPTGNEVLTTQKVTKVDYEQRIERAPFAQLVEPEQVPYTKSPVYKLTDPRYQTGSNQRSPMNSERVLPPQQPQQPTSSASSFRSGIEQQQLQRPTQPPPQPQPLTRTVRQPPPPVPADRASISSRDRVQQPDYESQALAAQQDFEQQRQLNDRAMQILTNRQQQPLPSSLRQPNSSSTAISREFKTNETSKSGSNISTPDASRSKKQIVTEVNHKDLLLKAIQMATELDPELEVEKVEITTEE